MLQRAKGEGVHSQSLYQAASETRVLEFLQGRVLVWKTASHKSPGKLFNVVGFGHSHHEQMLDMYDKFFMSFHKYNSFLRTRNAKIFFTGGQQIMFQNTLMEIVAANLGDSIPIDTLTLQFHMSTRWWSNSLGTLPGTLCRRKAKLKSLFRVYQKPTSLAPAST